MSDLPLGAFAEAHAFTCSTCGRVGGRWGVDDDEWRRVGDALVCAACPNPNPHRPNLGAKRRRT